MQSKYNNRLIPLAKQMRKEMTKEDHRLWYDYLRGYPVRFSRQKVLGKYIADFYCAKIGLVIELDGSQHYSKDGKAYDNFRTEKLNKFGITVLRISNCDIDKHFDNACAYIDNLARKLATERKINYCAK